MDREQLRRAEEFIKGLGLMPGRYEKKERHDGYQLYVASSSKRPPRFGYVRLNVGGQDAGKMIVYAIGDFLDPGERFTAQSGNAKDASYKFWPDDKEAWAYAARVVLSAYRSRA